MTTHPIAATVDARGLSCPMPIVKTAQQIRAVASGALIEVLAGDVDEVQSRAPCARQRHRGVLPGTPGQGHRGGLQYRHGGCHPGAAIRAV